MGALRRELVTVAVLILAGVACGLAWRLLVPFFRTHSDQQEALFAGDGALAAITAVAGLITGVIVVWRPGRAPAVRAGVVVAGSVGAAMLAWLTGNVFGAPTLDAVGVTLVWPVLCSIVIFTGAMLPVTSGRISSANAT